MKFNYRFINNSISIGTLKEKRKIKKVDWEFSPKKKKKKVDWV